MTGVCISTHVCYSTKAYLFSSTVSKVTLDVICATAFGYHSDSVQSDDNELAEAYHDLLGLQSGASSLEFTAHLSMFRILGVNISMLIALITFIPGFAPFLRSHFAFKYRKYLFPGPRISQLNVRILVYVSYIFVDELQTLVGSVHRIMAVSRKMLDNKLREANGKDSESKKDIMSLLVRARMNESNEGYRMSDQDLMEQVVRTIRLCSLHSP